MRAPLPASTSSCAVWSKSHPSCTLAISAQPAALLLDAWRRDVLPLSSGASGVLAVVRAAVAESTSPPVIRGASSVTHTDWAHV